jgi:hypothetical protein
MAAADYDRAYRPYDAPAPVREYDRPYRNDIVPYGDRRLDDVVKPPSRPPLPASTRSGGGGGRGVASALCFSDPEMKRRRRVASYKAYSVEGKVKSSLRRGFGWIKAKCSELIHGWYGPHPRRFLIFLLYFPFLGPSAALLRSILFSYTKRPVTTLRVQAQSQNLSLRWQCVVPQKISIHSEKS